MRKPAFCICENKDADQLRGNCEADQRLCFRYTDSTIPLLLEVLLYEVIGNTSTTGAEKSTKVVSTLMSAIAKV